MLAYTFYETDGRVMRYAEALAEAGAEVDVIALRKPSQPVEEMLNGVRVLRIQERERNEKGKLHYLAKILAFFLRSMIELSRRQLAGAYDIVHVHSVPDFEVFAALIPKVRGAKIILDIHDIVPEFYAAKFKRSTESTIFKALQLVERISASFADHVIIANDLWLQKIASRSVSASKCTAFINYPDSAVFNPDRRTRQADGKFVVIYPGTLNWHQGVDLAVEAVAVAIEKVPEIEFHIYGEGAARADIARLVCERGMSGRVLLKPPVPLRQVAEAMANADLGVVPKRNDAFGGEAFSTKILEFMSVGVPVIVADTRIDRHYFDDSVVTFFKAGDVEDLAAALVKAALDRQSTLRVTENALRYADTVSWARKKVDYLRLVDRLLAA